MESKYSVVLITAPDENCAKEIASELLDKKLVACVNIVGPIKSLYTWEEEVNEDSEYLMVCKTGSVLVKDQLTAKVNEIHPYDVPEIVALPIIDGHIPYLDWIGNVTCTK